jgi:hypothetical protein
MKCLHQFERTGTEDLGDRVLTKLSCTKCPKKRTVNRKKPRYVAQDTPRKPNVKRVPKLSKTLQNPRKRQRKAIPAMSEDKKVWDRLYKERLKSETAFGKYFDIRDHANGTWSILRKIGDRLGCEPHHPAGRAKFYILVFRWVTPQLHRQIHDLGHWARHEGLILKELEGRESEPDAKDPFLALPELAELKKQYT